jgi:3-isopropylmalate dehydrogenase
LTVAAASKPAPFRLLVLPGDGIGPEVIDQTLRIARWFSIALNRAVEFDRELVGGASIDAHGTPITESVMEKARCSDAILFGAVGGPRWDGREVSDRPEAGLIRLRRELDLFANLRPAVCCPGLEAASTLRPELVAGVDIIIVRELTSGVYFGQPRGREQLPNGTFRAFDTQAYTACEIERVLRVGFELARTRKRKLCSVDKSNVMETGAFWRSLATSLAAEYPDVELTHLYADNAAMQLMRDPRQFDVVVTDNLFGDILSDEAAMLTGSLGLLPSASLGGSLEGNDRGLYEPIHGSAPDIAGRGIANPLAAILSFAMCLRYSLAEPVAADVLENCVRAVLSGGLRTADLVGQGEAISTTDMTDAVLAELGRRAVSVTSKFGK